MVSSKLTCPKAVEVPALEPAKADLAGFLDVLKTRNPVLPPFEDDGVGASWLTH